MKNVEQNQLEQGHASIALAALFSAICVILLVIGANSGGILIWIGGIGAAVGILAQFWFTHEAITGILSRLDELEK
ncbi:MAG: hypothetical protein AAF633_08310 [Chloroflexota bacterium]